MVYRLDVPTASTTPPAAGTAGTEGFPSDTAIFDPYWAYSLCEEIRNVVVAAGLVPTKGNVAQLLAALPILAGGGMVGTMRNCGMNVTTAGTTVNFTADSLTLATALGGYMITLGGFSEALNLATTGVGGMDTGSAPHSSFVALYAIYNPATGAAALLAQDATGVVAPEVYGGAHMPAGYTYSALVSVWPTNSSGQLIVGLQIGRRIGYDSEVLTVAGEASITALSIASNVPKNAKKISGIIGVGSSSAGADGIVIYSTSGGVGQKPFYPGTSAVGGNSLPFSDLMIAVPQTIYYIAYVGSGTPNYVIDITEFEF